MRQIAGGLVSNEFERCGRRLSWRNVNCQENLWRITKNYSHGHWAPSRDMNLKLSKCQRKNADHF